MDTPTKSCLTTCVICGNYFEYEAHTRHANHLRARVVCDDCRANAAQQAKRRYRDANKRNEEEANFQKTTDRKKILKMTHQEIAGALGFGGSEDPDGPRGRNRVTATERRAMIKIRNNPELRKLFDTWIQDGALTEASEPPPDVGRQLLDYQMAVLDWWLEHDLWMEGQATAEADALLKEITRFQRKIAETLLKLL